MRIAERIAKLKHAQALVTGDAVGQVASQTLENMSVIGRVASLPVLRPLVGMDKEEIIAEAQRLGTFPISIIPDQDCCTLFTPRHPATKAKPDDVERAEAELPLDDMVRQAVDAAAVEHFTFRDRPHFRFASGKRGGDGGSDGRTRECVDADTVENFTFPI